MIQNEEYIQDFVEEARGHIETAEACLIKLDSATDDKELINSFFRAVHSMKGTAGFFNLTKIVELSHAMESLLGEVRNEKLTIHNDMIDNLIEAVDTLKVMVEDVLNSEEIEISSHVNKLSEYYQKEVNTDIVEETKTEVVSLNDEAKEEESTEEIVEEMKDEDKKIVEDKVINEEKEENGLEKDKKGGENATVPKFVNIEDSIRVHVSLLNNLLNLASELVLGRNQLLRAMEKHRKMIPGIDSILQNVDHITTELQEQVMQTRMQPVGNVFNKFPRVIRELGKKLAKEINLTIEGSDVELDKSIIEALGDPLIHLIRNAADHGLERPSEREKAGKTRCGNVLIKAYHEGGYVNIDIIDDGAGIDIEVIKRKAIEKALIDKIEALQMGEHEVLQLLFKPGFSTSETITDVSGRGVGMDVVKTNIEKLGGTIEIFTSLGHGTTFRLLLPLTLAIIPSIIVEVESQKFALPQVNLQEIVRIKASDIKTRIEYVNNSEVLRLRGGLLPIVHLSNVLGIRNSCFGVKMVSGCDKKYEDYTDVDKSCDAFNKKESKEAARILVVKIGSRKIGLSVDGIHGSEEILVKPLPAQMKDCKCYSGVTIMGDGKIAMILDPEGIIEKSHLHFSDCFEDRTKIDMQNEDNFLREQQSLLVFKCSGEETYAVDLSMVSRVEEISVDEIHHIGDNEYIKFRGDTLRVIRPENYLPVTKGPTSDSKSYVIIPKHMSYPVGILIHKIEDTLQTRIKLASDSINSKGIIGSTILGNKIVILINICGLFELADPDKFISIAQASKSKEKVVLVVEDTPFFQRLEKDYLENAGYKVVTADNGKEALQLLQEKTFDAVVSDIQMPLMDGLELIKKIRADKKLENLPVMAVTSMSSDQQRKIGLDSGFDVYEFKIDKVRLLDGLERAMEVRGKNL